MRPLLFILLFIAGASAHAQHAGQSLWLNVDYTYSDFTYKEPTTIQKGRLAGVRGDVGLGLLDNFGVTVGGQYQDGNLNYDGALATGENARFVTSDYFKETFAMATLMAGPVTFSAGVAQREWYNNLNGHYRRRESAQYFPSTITFYKSGFYLKGEMFTWKSGHVKMYMHDVQVEETDVDLNQGSGNGYGGEVGFLIPNAMHAFSRIYLSYRKWDIGASDAQMDPVQRIMVDKHTVEIWQAGVGISF